MTPKSNKATEMGGLVETCDRLEKERDEAVEAVELLLKGREWPGGFAVIARQARTLAGLSTVTKESHDKKN